MDLKIVIICAAILFVPVRIFAQYNSETTSYTKKAQSALETKKTGATITMLGALALTIGLITVNSDLDAGAAIGMGGLVATTIGLPIWIVGSVNHKKYTRKAQSLIMQVRATPNQLGLNLTYRF
jgi:hypothetical protein